MRGPMWSAPQNRILGHPQQLPIGLEMASQSAGLSPPGPLTDSTNMMHDCLKFCDAKSYPLDRYHNVITIMAKFDAFFHVTFS